MAGHVWKALTLQGTQLVSEADTYYSGRQFPSREPDGGLDLQSLTIEYFYPTSQSGSGTWSCSLLTSTGVAGITYEAATNVLTMWGVTRR